MNKDKLNKVKVDYSNKDFLLKLNELHWIRLII
jgi:hypothetical protein